MDESPHEKGTTLQEAARQLLDSTSDPAYTVDEHGCMSGWNGPAEQLLEYPRNEILGRPCHEVLRGRDVFGNPFCEPDCPLLLMARRREPVRHFQMDVYAQDGTALRVLCFGVVIPDSRTGSFSLLHLLRPVSQPLSPWPERKGPDQLHLTARELEVLRLLVRGSTTREMAEAMNVSTSTVRKHVQNLLRKVGASSRLAAVLAALEKRIL
jgi:DNA-binding CsgD family transcriptional regulator